MDSLLSLREEVKSIQRECDVAIKLNFKYQEEIYYYKREWEKCCERYSYSLEQLKELEDQKGTAEDVLRDIFNDITPEDTEHYFRAKAVLSE